MKLAAALRTQTLLARRDIWSGGRPRRGLVPIVLSLLLATAFTAMFAMMSGVLMDVGATPEARARLLAWAFTFAFVLLTLGDLLTVVSAAATAPDLERLLVAPVRPREILTLKFAETFTHTIGPILAIALPAALCFAWMAGGVNPVAFVVALLALWAVPLGLGSAGALALLQVAPAARVRESVAVLATFAFLGGWLANTFWMPRLLAQVDVDSLMRTIPPPPAWSPATWAADAIARSGTRGFEAIAACIAAAAAAFALAFAISERLLVRLQSGATSEPGRTVRGTSRRAATLAGAFLRRDVRLFLRDWPVLLDLFARLLLWALLPLAVLPLTPMPRAELVRDMLITLTLSLGNDVGTRALPIERHSLAWARLSPVGGARWVLHRALGVGLLSLAILAAGAGLAGTALGLPPFEMLDAFVFAVAAAATSVGFGLLVGAKLADPEWRDPRAMLGPGGRTVSAFVLLSQGACWIAASHAIGPGPVGPAWLGVMLALGALVAAATVFATARTIERREYTAR